MHGTASKTFASFSLAKAYATKAEHDMNEGLYVPATGRNAVKLGRVLDHYLSSPDFHKIVDQAHRVRYLAWWAAHYGERTMGAFGAELLQARARLARGEGIPGEPCADDGRPRRGATCNRYIAALSKALAVAKRDKIISHNPLADGAMARLPESKPRERTLGPEEEQRLLDACTEPELRLLVELALATAARRGELKGLRWQYVDTLGAWLTFPHTKNGTARRVKVPPHALRLLRAHEKATRPDGSPGALVFPSKNPDKPREFREAFECATQAAGLGKLVFHELRHSALTAMAQHGATLRELAEVAGHKTLAMVQRYSHLAENATAAIIERTARARTLARQALVRRASGKKPAEQVRAPRLA
jgi:integrase